MELKTRKTNLQEKYACSVKAVKNMFGNENVYISFGYLSREFSFDSSDRIRPKIKGTVITSASTNKRDGFPYENEYHISFYVIKDLIYDVKNEETFIKSYLPLLYKWYQEMLARPETAPSGVENFLIEWVNGDFETHSYRYH